MVKVIVLPSKNENIEKKIKVSKAEKEVEHPKLEKVKTSPSSWAEPKKEKNIPEKTITKPDNKSPASWATPNISKKETVTPKEDVNNKSPASWATLKNPKKDELADFTQPIKNNGESAEKLNEEFINPETEIKKDYKSVKSGIPGLDDVLDGGIPEGNLVTVSGGPGSGKTIMCLQFIYEGASKYNEPGVFVTLEEEPERLMRTGEEFGWDFEKLIKKEKIIIAKTPMYKFNLLKDSIRENVTRIGAKRLVIDPGALLGLFFERDIDSRKALIELSSMLKKIGCTTIITTEANAPETLSQSDLTSDGIIFLYYTKVLNQFMRMIAIIKMRGTQHSEKIHPIRFTQNGLEVMSNEEVFNEVIK
ncbi:Circadian clock protein kinase KaiC [Candidatus Tiddalikarchaeum anstoanum]|nr:Circadian clock protein kinase KaiC [Candidatus Tiddalikarchaeum anstoanum]